MGCLVPALALHPLNSIDAVDDGFDTLLQHCEVRLLRQALQHVSKVYGGVPQCHLGEYLGQGALAEPSGLVR